jgi:hypothetical protein
MEVGRGLVYPH